MCTSSLQTRAPSGLSYAGVLEVHSLNPRESTTAYHQSQNIGRLLFVLQSDKPAHSEPSGRSRTRAPADYTTTGFGAQGYLPGETITHCVGGATKCDHKVQRVATSQGGAAWRQRRQLTVEDVTENAKELVGKKTTVTSERRSASVGHCCILVLCVLCCD